MEGGAVHQTVAGTPQGGVISPLLSNIYLHVLDRLWMRHSAPLGRLVRYADDLVVMCRTGKDCEQAGLARNRPNAPALTLQYPYLHCLLLSQHGRSKNRHLLPGGPLLPRRSGSHYNRR